MNTITNKNYISWEFQGAWMCIVFFPPSMCIRPPVVHNGQGRVHQAGTAGITAWSLLKKRVLSTAETVGKQSEIGFTDGFPTKRASLKSWLEKASNCFSNSLYRLFSICFLYRRLSHGLPTIFRLFSDGFPSTN